MQRNLSFGGRVPWAVGLLLVLTIAASLVVAFGDRHGGSLYALLSLSPDRVIHLELWRLATWCFIEPSPLSLIFGSLALYWFGKDLASEWGSPRFLTVFGAVTLFAAAATCGVAVLDPAVRGQHYLGSWAAISAMVVAWGLWFPDQIVRIYFVLPIRGIWLAWGTILLTSVFAIYTGWEGFLPELFGYAGILAWLFRRSLTARVAGARRAIETKRRRESARRERSERDKRREKASAYLRVIESTDDDEPPPLPPDVEDKVRDLFKGKK